MPYHHFCIGSFFFETDNIARDLELIRRGPDYNWHCMQQPFGIPACEMITPIKKEPYYSDDIFARRKLRKELKQKQKKKVKASK